LVYVEEIGIPGTSIQGVSTSTAGFVGPTRRGPFADRKPPAVLTSFADFERIYGGLDDLKLTPRTNYLAHAAKAFFDEGGRRLYVGRVRVAATRTVSIQAVQNALASLASISEISIVAAPGSTEFGPEANAIQSLVIAHAEAPGAHRFAILDIPKGRTPGDASAYRKLFESHAAGFFYPWVVTAPGLPLPASGFVCGILARTDIERGVSTSPANAEVRSAAGLERDITKAEQDVLNPDGVNCLRRFEGRGIVVWGARTASSDPEWKYVNIRRYFTYLERSIGAGTQWAVFEPNDEPLWSRVREAIAAFLANEWRHGALAGRKPEEAFFVRCDRTTMTRNDIDNGRLVCLVGVALIKPAEFVIFRIGQWTADGS